jgi:gamma-glutamyl-gamma-aminobutyrate hydrolase PuuD
MFTARGWQVVSNLEDADLLQLTGGEDVSPELYEEEVHPKSFINPHRDKADSTLYHQARKKEIPIAGICRGGQLLNVLNGGKMWQHVDQHAIMGTHEMFYGQECISVTSTHHQMMIPSEESEVLGVAFESFTKEKMDGYNIQVIQPTEHWEEDAEIVWYKQSKSLCFQPHPEIVPKRHECQELYFRLLKSHCNL